MAAPVPRQRYAVVAETKVTVTVNERQWSFSVRGASAAHVLAIGPEEATRSALMAVAASAVEAVTYMDQQDKARRRRA